jgi:hypothetical protein
MSLQSPLLLIASGGVDCKIASKYEQNGISSNCLYTIKCQQYIGVFITVLHFTSERALLQEDGLKKVKWMFLPLPTHIPLCDVTVFP